MNKLELALLITFISLFVLFVLYWILINITLSIILSSPNKSLDFNEENLYQSEDGKYRLIINKKWLEETPHQEVSITSFDNIKLNAKFYRPYKTSHRYVIFAHGYRGRWYEQSYVDEKLAARYHMNFLLIEQRGHQKSKAKYTTMGIKESKDILKWIEYITNIDKKAEIFLMGHSMGGFTIGLTIGNDLAKNIKCAYIEASYESIYSQYQYILKRYAQKIFKSGWMLPSINLMSKIRMKIDLKTSLKDSLHKSKIPLFLLHGDEDRVVPFSNFMNIQNDFNKETKLTTYIGKGADHILSIYVNEKEYLKALYSFLDEYFTSFN